MSQRSKVNRDDQRRARQLMRERRMSYMQALEVVRSNGGGNGSGSGDAVTWWLKSLHYRHDGWTIQPGEQTWISDIGRIDEDGNRVYRKDGTPWGEPSWKIGDQVGLYLSGTLRVPILVEVIAPARFDPDFGTDAGRPRCPA